MTSIIPQTVMVADGTVSSAFGDDQARPGLQFFAHGTFGGGTAKVQYSWNGLPFQDLPGATLTANGVVGGIRASRGERFQIVLTGATAPSLNVGLVEVV